MGPISAQLSKLKWPFYRVFESLELTHKPLLKWKVHNTKVVVLEKLNKNGIQNLFIWSQEEGEKLKLRNWVELFLIYETTLVGFSSRRLYAGAPGTANPFGFARFCPCFAPWTPQLASRAAHTRPGPLGHLPRSQSCATPPRCRRRSPSSTSSPDNRPPERVRFASKLPQL